MAALIARGYSNRQIAEQLVVARGTVANHVAHILDKLGFHSRTQIAGWAVEHQLGEPAGQVSRPSPRAGDVHGEWFNLAHVSAPDMSYGERGRPVAPGRATARP